jgi:GUN4-like
MSNQSNGGCFNTLNLLIALAGAIAGFGAWLFPSVADKSQQLTSTPQSTSSPALSTKPTSAPSTVAPVSPTPTLEPQPSLSPSLQPTPAAIPQSKLDKESEVQILSNQDYEPLQVLLDKKEWKPADLETHRLMIKAGIQAIQRIRNIDRFLSESTELDWLEKLNIKNQKKTSNFLEAETLKFFPCGDLTRINQLWTSASNGRFGFSAQKKIYLDKTVGKHDLNGFGNPWYDFSENVGWVQNNWAWTNAVEYSEYRFNTSAPLGHLPSYRKLFSSADDNWNYRRISNIDNIKTGQSLYYIMYRLERCGI